MTWIASETRQESKLRARVKEAIVDYNRTIAPQFRGTSIGARQEEPAGGLIRGVEGQVVFPPTPATAVMLCKPVKTRFASIESTLPAYIRTRLVLLGVVQSQDFCLNLWTATNAAGREKRSQFISILESQVFLAKLQDLHRIFSLIRRYLSVFDSDDAKISDVVPKTIALGLELQQIPVTSFLTAERRDEVLAKFRKGQNGPLDASIKVRLLEDIHFAAHLLDPHRCPRDIDPY